MVDTRVLRECVNGYDHVSLQNNQVSLSVVPALGAKIVSLKNLITGREWMWASGKQPKLFSVPSGTPYADGPVIGADECIPTISACHWRGMDLPCHGEAWSVPWSLDEEALIQTREIRTALDLPISTLHIVRRIELVDACVRLHYTVENRSTDTIEYIWAFHPLMTIQPEDRLELPLTCRTARIEVVMGGCPVGDRGDTCNWPIPCDGVDYSRLDLGGSNRAIKLYTEPLPEGYASITNDRSGDRLTFSYPVSEIDTLGIWINRGGWEGHNHIAIEPTSGAPDALDSAVQDWDRFATVASGQTNRWRLELEVRAD
jgi:galactose mutarotase-like enzyme